MRLKQIPAMIPRRQEVGGSRWTSAKMLNAVSFIFDIQYNSTFVGVFKTVDHFVTARHITDFNI